MKRTVSELTANFRSVIESQSEDELASFLEDLSDSVVETDLSGYVPREEFDAVRTERDLAIGKAQAYRDKYINRFYEPGNGSTDQTLIESEASQAEIEQEERRVTYDDLFE